MLKEQPFSIFLYPGSSFETLPWPSLHDSEHYHLHVYQSREFLELWIQTVGAARDSECYFVILHDDDGEPFFFLPLCIEKKLGLRILCFMDGGVADSNGPIIRRGAEINERVMRSTWARMLELLPAIDAIDLAKIAAEVDGVENPLIALPTESHPSSGNLIEIELLGSWDNYVIRSKRKKSLSKLAKKSRACSKMGPVLYQVAENHQKAEMFFEVLYKHKRAQFLLERKEDSFELPGIKAFYFQSFQGNRLNSLVEIAVMRCGSDVMAASLNFLSDGYEYASLLTYDRENYGVYSPGILLLVEKVKAAFHKKLRGFDLGEGNYGYKNSWVTRHPPLLAHRSSRTVGGTLYFLLKRMMRLVVVRRLYNKIMSTKKLSRWISH